MASRASIKPWLKANGYLEILALIEEIEAEWKVQRKGTRRNWWDVLAGDTKGRSKAVAGRTFPVLAAAQERQDLPVTKNAIRGAGEETAPGVWRTGRWPPE